MTWGVIYLTGGDALYLHEQSQLDEDAYNRKFSPSSPMLQVQSSLPKVFKFIGYFLPLNVHALKNHILPGQFSFLLTD